MALRDDISNGMTGNGKCAECNGLFKAERAHKKYCSLKCANRARVRKHRNGIVKEKRALQTRTDRAIARAYIDMRYCVCGHTVEMHDDGNGGLACMEPGEAEGSFCPCKLFDSSDGPVVIDEPAKDLRRAALEILDRPTDERAGQTPEASTGQS